MPWQIGGADPFATLIEHDSRQTLTGTVCRTRRHTASVLEPERMWFAVRMDRNMALWQSFRDAVAITCFSLSKRPHSCKGRLHSGQQFRPVYIDFPIWLPPGLLQPVGMFAQTFFQGPLLYQLPLTGGLMRGLLRAACMSFPIAAFKGQASANLKKIRNQPSNDAPL